MDVIGIGSAFVDYFFEDTNGFLKKHGLKPEGDFLFSQKKISPKTVFQNLSLLTKSPGGNTPNTLAVLAKLKLDVGYMGVIGKDASALYWLKNLKNIHFLKISKFGKTSICTCILSRNRTKRTFLSEVNTNETIFLKKAKISDFENSKFIFISSFIENCARDIALVEKLVSQIKTPKIVFSPGVTFSKLKISKLKKILAKTYILFVNEQETKILTCQNPQKGSKKLITFGPKIVVCTLGEKGSIITTSNKQFRIPANTPKKIIDTTGAGDAYVAGFLYGLIIGKTLKWSAKFASKIAAISISDFGLNWLSSIKNDL